MAINGNTQIYDKVIDRAAMIRLYERRVQGKVELVLDGHSVRLDKLIKDAHNSPAGFLKLREAVDQELQETYAQVHSLSKRSLLDLFADQVSFAYQNVENAMGKIWRTQRPVRRVAEEVVLERPLYNDRTLEEAWTGVSIGERKRIEAVIRKGIAAGATPSDIALDVRRGNVHNITKNQSQALVTTAITSVHNQADHEVYKANAKALTGWMYVAVLDSRTTSLCSHRDGTIYPIGDVKHLPPAHWNCRSTSVPVFKSWEDVARLEGVAQVRKRNLQNLTDVQKAYYDGQTPLRESYNDWLKRQPTSVQLRHLGEYRKVEMLNSGELTLDKFTNDKGNTLGVRELRQLTDNDYVIPGDTRKFANAKARLDAMQLGASSPEDLYGMQSTLVDYFLLQAGDLNGNLAVTSYRGTLLHNKRNTRNRVLSSPPTEDQLRYNPLTGRYDDVRIYQPNADVYAGALRRVRESTDLNDNDKQFIESTLDRLAMKMGMNERAVVAENLRVIIGRYRKNPEAWGNAKAVIQSQMKFDIMNTSDAIETQIRKDSDVLKKLMDDDYIDPVLGRTQLDDLSENFIANIKARNRWEDTTAVAIAHELRDWFDLEIPRKLRSRIDENSMQQFYLRFAHRLGAADSPDRDALAIALGRDLHNIANYNGDRKAWYNLGLKLLEKKAGHLFEIDTFGVQKRRMRSRLSGAYFGPYYDTVSYYINIQDPRIAAYSKLSRQVELGLRVAVTNEKNRLLFREGYKTYFIKTPTGYVDTRIPITSTSSFSDFPVEFVDKNLVDALNWAAQAQYKVDEDFFDFTQKLLYFKDDRGNAKKYDELNHYRKYITTRGDAYERFKSMQWLRQKNIAFSNHPFVDHRARVYDRGLISPQSGESFRPFLNTAAIKPMGVDGYNAFTDQIGAFLGGLSDFFEGKYDGLTFVGRQRIAEKWHNDMVNLGNAMLRGKPADMRYILEHEMTAHVDGEELGKFFRLAMETAKIDAHIKSTPSILKYSEGLNREGTGAGSFTHRGSEYDVNSIFAAAQDKPVKELTTEALSWILKYDKPDPTRLLKADTSVPIVVFKEADGTAVVADGLHRLAKAVRQGNKVIKVQEISLAELEMAKVGSRTYSYDNLKKLDTFMTGMAMEQDASSSGAQIIALTTRNKQLASLSNVVPTNQKRRLYDEIAAATYNDPRFKVINEKLGLKLKDLQKAAKAQNMVTFYGAGERTGILNVEGKLGKVLGKDQNTLVVTASQRQTVLNEIDARIARVARYDPEGEVLLRQLRADVRDIFNKGQDPGDQIMEQLYFLDPATKDIVEKLSQHYERVVTPDDFKKIANIMSDHLAEQVPILKDFTRFFGRLAEDFLSNAKPSDADFDWKTWATLELRGKKKGARPVLPPAIARQLGIDQKTPVSEKLLSRLFYSWNPNSGLASLLLGGTVDETRAVGRTLFKLDLGVAPDVLQKYTGITALKDLQKATTITVGMADQNKMPKTWARVPWVNFDGKTIEQNFTQSFEERLVYKDKEGNWVTNILMIPQKSEASWWDQVLNKSGAINDIADATKARTAFAVNGNHSNDAVIVKKFHLWGRKNGVSTSTVHDAFFTNIADMLPGRSALRGIYAETLQNNVVKMTLDEMKARGLPQEIYDRYMNEAIDKGLIPVAGRSVIGGRTITEQDILTVEDVLEEVPYDFEQNYGWYGVG